jgi:ABC-type amino acid transport substrate-binding protein
MKTIGFILIISITLGIFWGKRISTTAPEAKILRVGMMSGWAPFMTLSAQGGFQGFDVDVAQELATSMGYTLQIVDLGSLAPLFVALEQEKIDLIFSGLDITQERKQKLSMVPYTGQSIKNFSLVFWEIIPSGVQRIEDLKNLPEPIVSVEPGSSQEKFLDRYLEITKKNLPTLTDMLLDLQYGRSRAMLLEPQVANRLQVQNPKLKILSVALPPEFETFGLGIAVKKTRAAFSKQVTQVIHAMRSKGKIAELENKWQLSSGEST